MDRTWNAGANGGDYPVDLAFGASDEVLALITSSLLPNSEERVLVAWDPLGTERWTWHGGISAIPPSGYTLEPRIATVGPAIFVSESSLTVPANGTDYALRRLQRTASIVCVGDAPSGTCPCANGTAPILQAGCATSQGTGGHLIESGASSLANDTLVLHGSGMPDSSVLYVQGTIALGGGSGVQFGDGLRCVGGTITRLGRRTNQGGASSYPGAGDAPISVKGAIGSSVTRIYQAWFRNAAPFCTAATFNLTNGLIVEWTP